MDRVCGLCPIDELAEEEHVGHRSDELQGVFDGMGGRRQ